MALAAVLAMRPEILVLDEPATFLDPPAQRNLLHLLASLPEAKLIVTYRTRSQPLSTCAVFFEKGKLVADGPVDESFNAATGSIQIWTRPTYDTRPSAVFERQRYDGGPQH